MNWILYAIFALSGATSLAFEALWFRQAGLTFGNSVWATSLVLSSFMAGIALGNGIAARQAARFARPLVAYALLELAIAISGVSLVFALPSLTGAIAQVLAPFLEDPWIVNPIRLTIGFLLLLAPATAMGATLPLVVRTLHARDPNFGSVLGRLYGTNTLGAMVGAVVGEAFLIQWLGIRGSAILVGGLGLLAASGALVLARQLPSLPTEEESTARGKRISAWTWRLLAATFVSGGILLAFEVVWFRFLHLFAHGGPLVFSLMLAMVLFGVSLGGFAGGWWLRRDPSAFRHAASLAFLAGCVSVAVYWGFEWVIEPYESRYVRSADDVLWLTACLTFLPSLLSGVLFTWVGSALETEVSPDSRATGLLTLSNTLGAGLGSIAAGFVLLPYLGMERSFQLLAALYGLVGFLLLVVDRPEASAWRLRWVTATAFVATMVVFPSGLLERDYLHRIVSRFGAEMRQVALMREGVQQTLIYLRHEFDGEPFRYRLVTDGYSMSGTGDRGRRYMKMFVYWAMAVHPDAKRALLISYGVGETAKALTETASLEHIDVVDISREILDSTSILYPDPDDDPLNDPRVRVHVEDGRYFLRTTEERFDLITGEPPPPKIAGVVSLYTREYFELVYDRLAEGGVNTYWLPVFNLSETESKAIIRAYCEAFDDCALWSVSGLNWMLTGSRNPGTAPSEAAFTRQWRDPIAAEHLRAVGVDSPELFGTLFMAGPTRLREITADTKPLVDDFPKRIGNETTRAAAALRVFAPWMDARRTRREFRDSDYIRRVWPPGLRERTDGQFDYQRMLLESFRPAGPSDPLGDLHRILTETPYWFLAVHMLGQDTDTLGAIHRLIERGVSKDRYRTALAAEAFASRDFTTAARHLRQEMRRKPREEGLTFLHLYALCMSGDLDRARAIAARTRVQWARTEQGREYADWLEERFDLDF